MMPSLLVALTLVLPGSMKTPAMPMPCYQPQAGDILLFRNPGVKDVLFVFGGSPCITHSAIVVARPDGTLAIFETPGPKFPVMLSDIPSRLQSYNGTVWVRRLRTPLTSEQSQALTAFADAQDAKPYDLRGVVIPYFGPPVCRWRTRCVQPEQMHPARWFCSPLVIAAGIQAGLLNPCQVRLRTTDPEDLMVDRQLDLSPCWDKPIRLDRCGPRTACWWSESCNGARRCWRD